MEEQRLGHADSVDGGGVGGFRDCKRFTGASKARQSCPQVRSRKRCIPRDGEDGRVGDLGVKLAMALTRLAPNNRFLARNIDLL